MSTYYRSEDKQKGVPSPNHIFINYSTQLLEHLLIKSTDDKEPVEVSFIKQLCSETTNV